MNVTAESYGHAVILNLKGELTDDNQEKSHGIADQSTKQWGIAGHKECDQSGKTQSCGHPKVYVLQYGPLACCDILEY